MRSAAPQSTYERLESGGVVLKGWRALRRHADDRRPLFDQSGDALERAKRHDTARPAKIQRLVARLAGDQFALFDPHPVRHDVRIDEIISVARGQVRRHAVFEQRCDRLILAIEISNVGMIPPLLQQEAGARHIVDPGLGHFRPAFMPIEILTEDHQAETRLLVIDRLVHGRMDDRPIDPGRKFQINDALEVRRRKRPGCKGRRHGFGRHDILAVNMSDRRCSLHVADQRGTRRGAPVEGPHRPHGHIGMGAHGKIIAQHGPRIFQRLAIQDQAIFMRHFRDRAIMGVGEKVRQRLAIVVKESIASGRRTHHRAGQRRQIGHRVIAAPGLEFLDHARRPVGGADFDAVGQQRVDPLFADPVRADGIAIHAKIGFQIAAHGAGIIFVDFQAGRFGRGGMVGLARERIAHAQDMPVAACGRGPVERAVRPQTVGQVDHAGGIDRGCGGGDAAKRGVIGQDRIARLGFILVDLRFGRQTEVANAQRGAGGSGEDVDLHRAGRAVAQAGRLGRVIGGEDQAKALGRDRREADRRGHFGQGEATDGPPTLRRLCLQGRAVGRVAEGRTGMRHEQAGRSDGDGLAIVEQQRARRMLIALADLRHGVQILIEQGRGDDGAAIPLRHARLRQRHEADGIGEDARIGIMVRQRAAVFATGQRIAEPGALERARHRRRRRQGTGQAGAASQVRLAPDQLLHAILRLDPGAARLAPARRGGDGEFQLLGVGGAHRMAEGVLPAIGHIGQPLGHDLRRLEIGVEILHAANADSRHPVEILVDPVLRHIAVHPMPPDARTRRLRGIAKAVGQIVGKRRTAKQGAGEQSGEAQAVASHQCIFLVETVAVASNGRSASVATRAPSTPP